MYFEDKSDVPYIDKFLSYCDDGSSILDVGCGVGNFSQYINRRGHEVVGVDLSEKCWRSQRSGLGI